MCNQIFIHISKNKNRKFQENYKFSLHSSPTSLLFTPPRSGIQGVGGTTLVYVAREPQGPWHFDGLLCCGSLVNGTVWECPLIVELEVRGS